MKKCAITGEKIESGVVVDPAELERLKKEVIRLRDENRKLNEFVKKFKRDFTEPDKLYIHISDLDNEMHHIKEQKCRVCGCTENHACPGGCYWVEWDLCSKCVGKEAENYEG